MKTPQRLSQRPVALVLDDDPIIRSEIGEFFDECDYRVRYCKDFIDAMQEMEFDDEVTVVVADYHLLGNGSHSFNGMRFIDCCRMRYPERAVRYFLMSGDNAPLAEYEDDPDVPMIPKLAAIEQLTAHIVPFYPPETRTHYGRIQT